MKLNKVLSLKRIRLFLEKARWTDHFIPFNLGCRESYLDEEGWDKMTEVANPNKRGSSQMVCQCAS